MLNSEAVLRMKKRIQKEPPILFSVYPVAAYKRTELKKKNPDVTYFSVLTKITSGLGIPEEFIWAIAIVSEDFAYGCTEFPTFGMKPNQMVNKIKEILSLYVPF